MRFSAFSSRSWYPPMLTLIVTLLFLYATLLVFWKMKHKTLVLRVEKAKARSDALEQHVRDICKTMVFSNKQASRAMGHMHYDDERKVIYCYIPKVASTSWKRVWLKMTANLKPGQNVSSISRYTVHTSLPLLASDKNKEEKLRTYKKFMVVRHPFERVLSAYRDKLEREYENPGYNFHKQIGKQIQMKYRGNTEMEGHNVTFSEFIRFISEPGHGTPEQRNEHWLPMHELCQPCAVQYDFISKYENLKEDAEYLLKWLGVTDLMDGFPASDRTFNASRYDPKYFGQLSHQEIIAFFAKHLPDFLLFDYSFV